MGGFFWEDFFGGLLGGYFEEDFFGRIFWEDYWEDFLGGILWEKFFVYIGIDLFVKILSQGKKEGKFKSLEVRVQAHRT